MQHVTRHAPLVQALHLCIQQRRAGEAGRRQEGCCADLVLHRAAQALQDAAGEGGTASSRGRPSGRCTSWGCGRCAALAPTLTRRCTALQPMAPGATFGWVAVVNTLRGPPAGRRWEGRGDWTGTGCMTWCWADAAADGRCQRCAKHVSCMRAARHARCLGGHSQRADLQELRASQGVIWCQVHAVCKAGALRATQHGSGGAAAVAVAALQAATTHTAPHGDGRARLPCRARCPRRALRMP